MASAVGHEPHGRHQSKKAAASGWIGSALEYYDFFIYATAASLIFPQIFFPSGESHGRHRRLARDLRRRLRRATDRRLRARPLGRHARPQERADPVHVPDGLLDHGGRRAADLPAGRAARAGAARHPAPDPGLRGGRRDLRRQLDDPRARAVRPARLLRQLHPAGRAGRPDPGRGGVPAARRLHARGGVQLLGLAHPVPAQLRRHHRRLHHPPRGRRDAGLRRGGRSTARCRKAPIVEAFKQQLAATCCASSAWR